MTKKAGMMEAGMIKGGMIRAGVIKAGMIKAGMIKAGMIQAGVHLLPAITGIMLASVDQVGTPGMVSGDGGSDEEDALLEGLAGAGPGHTTSDGEYDMSCGFMICSAGIDGVLYHCAALSCALHPMA